jgi:ankyrin repeat protein
MSKSERKAARIHRAVAEGDDCVVIDLTKPCCFKLASIVEARDPITDGTPLLTAAVGGDVGIGKILLSRGADVHAVDSDMRTAMHVASLHNHVPFLDLLLDHEANVDAPNREGMTPLFLAIHLYGSRDDPQGKGVEAIRFLLSQRSNIKICSGPEEHTPFLRAVALGHQDVVSLFLTCGRSGREEGKEEGVVGVDQDRDAHGRTGFMLAIAEGSLEMAALLLQHGADMEAKDKAGMTALAWAAGRPEKLTLGFLLERGANVRIQDTDTGATPLMLAAQNGDVGLVQLLVEGEADLESKDGRGYTALMHAAARGHSRVVSYLMDQTALQESQKDPTSAPARRNQGRGSDPASARASDPPSHYASPEDVAVTEEIKSLVRRAKNCGAPILPSAPTVRKEKLDPLHPSILLAFEPPRPTAACPKLGVLTYTAECFAWEEAKGEEGKAGGGATRREAEEEEGPVAVVEGVGRGQSPFIFRGLERGRWYLFKVHAQSEGGRGLSSRTDPIFLATTPLGAPEVKEAVVEAVVEEEEEEVEEEEEEVEEEEGEGEGRGVPKVGGVIGEVDKEAGTEEEVEENEGAVTGDKEEEEEGKGREGGREEDGGQGQVEGAVEDVVQKGKGEERGEGKEGTKSETNQAEATGKEAGKEEGGGEGGRGADKTASMARKAKAFPTLRVTVSAPADDGGQPITGYMLTAKPGNLKVESTEPILLLPGLTPGTSYSLSVAARNAAGYGPASRPMVVDVMP